MKSNKMINVLPVVICALVGTSAFANDDKAEYLNIDDMSSMQKPLVDMTATTQGAYRVKQGNSIVRTDVLTKGQVVIGKADIQSTLTGDVVVKLSRGVSEQQFADEYGLDVIFSTESNQVIFAPKNNGDLAQLLKYLKSDNRVESASLDKATDKYHIE